MKRAIIALEISTICHATEDLEKVRKALLNLIPPHMRSDVELEYSHTKGYYRNPITRIVLRVKGRRAEEVFKYIMSKMDSTEKKVILSTLDIRFDLRACKLYLRFSKQDAYLGSIVLFEGDDVIKVVATLRRVKNVDEAKELIKNFIEEQP